MIKEHLLFLFLACGALGAFHAVANPPLPANFTRYSCSIKAGPSEGSGFIMQASNSVYLVTARHVLFNDRQSPTNWPLWSGNAECTDHMSETSETVAVIDLIALSTMGAVRYSTNHDVATVRIEESTGTNHEVYSFLPGVKFQTAQTALTMWASTEIKRFDDIHVGMDIFLFGFPSSLGLAQMPQLDPSLPLVRKGIVAGKNLKRRALVLDCMSFQGNSGGLVVGKEVENLTTTRFPLLGVLVEWVPFSESWQNSRFGYSNQTLSNSGYSIAEPMDVVLELIRQ
jgi:hypothetical protein